MPYGTFSVTDTLASSQQSIAQYGEDRAFADIAAALMAHNRIVDQMTGSLVERTSDRQRRYGSQDTMEMQKVDEFGRALAQKVAAGTTVGFPLEGFEVAVQWTRLAFQNMRATELAAQFEAARDADIKNIQREIRRAIFDSVNVSFIDRRVDNVTLAVKRLVNADSASIPLGPNGETFNGATHTHYLARVGALAASDITAVVNTVVEHTATGQPRLYIARTEETAIRGFTSNFVPLTPVFISPADNTTRAVGNLDVRNPNDRDIGYWDQTALVSVKPWMLSGYMFAWMDGGLPPLVMRVRDDSSGSFQVLYDDEAHPLRARGLGREFGFGAWTRTNGAVLYTGGTTYTVPTSF